MAVRKTSMWLTLVMRILWPGEKEGIRKLWGKKQSRDPYHIFSPGFFALSYASSPLFVESICRGIQVAQFWKSYETIQLLSAKHTSNRRVLHLVHCWLRTAHSTSTARFFVYYSSWLELSRDTLGQCWKCGWSRYFRHDCAPANSDSFISRPQHPVPQP